MKIDLKKMKTDNKNEDDNENKKDLNVYNLKIYVVLEIFAEEKS